MFYMKNILKLVFTFLVAGGLFSCEKKVSEISFEEGTAPVLTASTANVSLEPGSESNTAVTFSWTNPDYSFSTGPSSHDVNYALEFDTLGANFSSSKKITTIIARDLSKTYTVGQLNGILGNEMILQLDPRRNYTIQARVTSTIGTALPLASNVISFVTKPFAPPPKVELPAAGTLWVVGDAATSGWSNPLPGPYDVSQKFTKLSNTLYELTVNLPGGGGYKLIQQMGNWDTQYRMVAGGTWEGGDFLKQNSDPQFPGPPTAGTYKITIDFQLGKFKVIKL
jgi:starch-binding outer membrane protein SusE/F